jgi:integrase/recombinase XerD
MLESIYSHGAYSRKALAFHLAAPLLEERERFLQHLEMEGATHLTLKRVAQGLINTIRCLELKKLRHVGVEEVQRVCALWQRRNRTGWSPSFFWTAKRWLRFHDRLRLPTPPRDAYMDKVAEFTQFLETQGLSPETVRWRRLAAILFLRWSSGQHRRLRSSSVNDIDDFFSFKKATRAWSPGTIANAAAALRSFFRYAERSQWCSRPVAIGIRRPRIPRYRNVVRAPSWGIIQRILADRGSKRADVRAHAILSLLATYGLRATDVINLRLADVNWKAKTLHVRRTKSRNFQRFPLERKTAASILRYLKNVRPKCSCPNLFVTLNPPFRPTCNASLWRITSFRFRGCGIDCRPRGPHALRYACAEHLLERGLSFKEISDFLGHRGLQSVRIYTKSDLKLLRRVADFPLGDLK